MKCVVIDNYDSFTYNLVQLVRQLTATEPAVFRNDDFSLDGLEGYDKILLSPGPGIPSEAGLLMEVIRRYGPTKSLLGICLGHQAIGEVYGAGLVRMEQVRHGVASELSCCLPDPLLNGLPETIMAGHYHSWMLSREQFPCTMDILMEDRSGNIMAVRHKQYDVRGLQFHPESVLTPLGAKLIDNWLNHTYE